MKENERNKNGNILCHIGRWNEREDAGIILGMRGWFAAMYKWWK